MRCPRDARQYVRSMQRPCMINLHKRRLCSQQYKKLENEPLQFKPFLHCSMKKKKPTTSLTCSVCGIPSGRVYNGQDGWLHGCVARLGYTVSIYESNTRRLHRSVIHAFSQCNRLNYNLCAVLRCYSCTTIRGRKDEMSAAVSQVTCNKCYLNTCCEERVGEFHFLGSQLLHAQKIQPVFKMDLFFFNFDISHIILFILYRNETKFNVGGAEGLQNASSTTMGRSTMGRNAGVSSQQLLKRGGKDDNSRLRAIFQQSLCSVPCV